MSGRHIFAALPHMGFFLGDLAGTGALSAVRVRAVKTCLSRPALPDNFQFSGFISTFAGTENAVSTISQNHFATHLAVFNLFHYRHFLPLPWFDELEFFAGPPESVEFFLFTGASASFRCFPRRSQSGSRHEKLAEMLAV